MTQKSLSKKDTPTACAAKELLQERIQIKGIVDPNERLLRLADWHYRVASYLNHSAAPSA